MSTIAFKEIGLRPAVARKVALEAKKAGKSPIEYVRWVVEKHVEAHKTFAELVKPISEDFKRAGVTPTQLEALVEEARDAHWRKTRRRKK
ncbi:MAG TPA: hypothetical protein VHQ47_11510 [Phycisphaerae bacterium]|jgi:hypothetical protein|nr:hypothetical protein [Phycisphaerae bacterium]